MIKLIVTDMDGTLLGDNHYFPEDFYEVFEQLQKRNILFCVASGRQYSSLLQFFSPIAQDMGFIAENGGHVMLHNKEFYEQPIDYQSINMILRACESIPDIGVALCGKNGSYLSCPDIYIQEYMRKYYIDLQYVDDLEKVDDTIFKITIFDKKGSQENSYPQLEKYRFFVKIVRSGDKWVDITNLSVNKGIAIEKIQEKFQISKQETMVFGDYLNDLEMMQRAHFSFAMKNAQPEVKRAANFITDLDNTESGVLKTIRKMLNI